MDRHIVVVLIPYSSKYLLPLVSYVFEDGPWRDTYVRLGYDPRQDPEARLYAVRLSTPFHDILTALSFSYQRLYFRNINHPILRPSVTTRRQEQRNESAEARFSGMDERRSHIFDGKTITSETAAFQLCDITDEMLKEMIEADDEDSVRDSCNERDGWYTTSALERIKSVLRLKFFSLLEGHIATREECERLLVPQEGTDKLPSRYRPKLKFGKHNMAKGALRPEDAAVSATNRSDDEHNLQSLVLGPPTHDCNRATEENLPASMRWSITSI